MNCPLIEFFNMFERKTDLSNSKTTIHFVNFKLKRKNINNY